MNIRQQKKKTFCHTILNGVVLCCILMMISVSSCNNTATTMKYIPTAADSIANDKNRLGLKGKVKTMDISFFVIKEKKSLTPPEYEKDKERKVTHKGVYRIQVIFNKDGNYSQQNEYDENGQVIFKRNYSYGVDSSYMYIDSVMTEDRQYIYKFNKDRKLLEWREVVGQEIMDGKINSYDADGNIVRSELLGHTDYVTYALTEYDYNKDKLLTEKREYLNKVKLLRKYIYTYNDKNLLIDEKVFFVDLSKPFLEEHFTYTNNEKNYISAKFEVDKDGNATELIRYGYDYYPDGRIKTVSNVLTCTILEEYDEQGRLVERNKRLGFENVGIDPLSYSYDQCNNWLERTDFSYLGYVAFLTEPFPERHFTYYE